MSNPLGPLAVALACALVTAAVSAAEDAGKAPPAGVAPVERGADGWLTARSEAGGFSISMPAHYRAVEAENAEASGQSRTYALQSRRRVAFGGFAYFAVICVDYLGDVPSPKQVFEEATAADDVLGSLEYRRDHPYRDRPGIEFLLHDQGSWYYARLYHLGSRICTLTVNSPGHAKPSEADRVRFFDSFEITAR